MSTPLRWRDDDAFRRESGIDLRALDVASPRFDVGAVRTGITRRLWIRRVVPFIGGAALFAGALWVGMPSAPRPLPLPAPVDAPLRVVAAPSPIASPVDVPVEAPVPPPAARRASATRSPDTAPAPTSREAEPGVTDDHVAPPAPVGEASELPRGPSEVAAYDAARALLAGGATSEALAAFADWPERFPHGMLHMEAAVAELDCLVRLGRSVEAERLAAALMADAQTTAFRAALTRLRATALVGLDRCDEALALVGEADRETAAGIRSACRGRRDD